MFEGDLFKLKQKYIDQDFKDNDEKWHELMKDGHELLKKYTSMNETIEYYTWQQFCTFVDFLDKKAMNKFDCTKVRNGLLEMEG